MSVNLYDYIIWLDNIEKNIEKNEEEYLQYITNTQLEYLLELVQETHLFSYRVHKKIFNDRYIDDIVFNILNDLDKYFNNRYENLCYHDFSKPHINHLNNAFRKYNQIKKEYLNTKIFAD